MGWRDSTAGSVFVCLECGPVQVLILGIPYGPPQHLWVWSQTKNNLLVPDKVLQNLFVSKVFPTVFYLRGLYERHIKTQSKHNSLLTEQERKLKFQVLCFSFLSWSFLNSVVHLGNWQFGSEMNL